MKTRLKLWIDWLKCTEKKLLKQGLDFPLENKIETMDRLAKIYDQKLLRQRLDFPFEKEIEFMDRLAKMHGQKIFTRG